MVRRQSPCGECGQLHARCLAHKKGTDPAQPCMRWPVGGELGTVCRFHGENKAVRAAAEARVQEVAARRELERLQGTRWAEFVPDSDPVAEMVALYTASAARVRWLESVVGSAQHTDLYASAVGPRVSPYVEWLGREQAELRQLVTAMHRMGVAERELRLAEAQAGQVAGVLQVLLDGLGLSAEQAARVPDLVRAAVTQVRALTGGAA